MRRVKRMKRVKRLKRREKLTIYKQNEEMMGEKREYHETEGMYEYNDKEKKGERDVRKVKRKDG